MAAAIDRRGATPVKVDRQTPTEPYPGPIDRFAFSNFLKSEYGFGLDPNRPFCKAFREGFCPLGTACPDKHGTAHSNNLVCKHWLKGLCKKGDQCDYLHEYNIRGRAECTNFNKTGYCLAGEECNYLHVDPASRLPPCPHYEKGFCPLGATCSKRHVRRTLCRFYLAGFCPYGRQCKEGLHPRFPEHLPKPNVKVEKTAEEIEEERERLAQEAERQEQRELERFDGNHGDIKRQENDACFTTLTTAKCNVNSLTKLHDPSRAYNCFEAGEDHLAYPCGVRSSGEHGVPTNKIKAKNDS